MEKATYTTPQAAARALKRSERTKQAAATRKANKEAQRLYEEKQAEARGQLLDALPEAEQNLIANELAAPWCVIEDEYENLLNEWYVEKEQEMATSIRTLLRKGTRAAVILAALENHVTSDFHFGVFSMRLDATEILQSVLLEDEFLGMNQPTPELKQRMGELTDTTVR
jgi:hypothetical protein